MVASLSKPMNQVALEQYHSKDNYYSQNDGLLNSQWAGRFSQHQGLQGPIKSGDWKQACQGQDPQGNELRRKQINSRAGWDITLSASKSASLKALVHQDPTVLEAHREAVIQTVQYIEENCIYAQVKQQGQLNREQTKQGQFALFEHDDNRKQEPQLHTHIVILNQTLCQDGKTRTLDSRELFNQKVTIGAYYDHAFAYQLQQKGYELEWTSDHTFEIKGYQKEQLEAFSSRRQAIREYLAHQNIPLEQATEAQKQIACLKSRPLKIHKLHSIDHEQQRERWQQESDRLGIIHPQPCQDLQQLYDLASHPGSLSEVIYAAIKTATAYQVAVTQQALLRDCLRHSQEYYSPIEIEQALKESAELISTQDGRLTTTRALEREQYILQSANDGQRTQEALATVERVEQISLERGLNEDQKAGLKHVAISEDFITLLQGDAGVGKTYTLNALKDCLTSEQSDHLKGLAPSAAAAEVLQAETDIPSTTVDGYLLTPTETLNRNETLLIDEAGMLSSQQTEGLIRKAQALDNRLIFVGDIKQLSAIEAGAPFRLLQNRSELKTVAIEANVRQRVPHLYDAASLAAQHRTNEALSRLEHCDCIEEIRDPQERNRQVVHQYLSRASREQAQTLILCDTNADRQDISTQIRAAYVENGILGQDSKQISILYSKPLDKQAITQSYSYAVGDVIRFQRPTKQFPDLYYRVTDIQDQTLILKDRQGNHHALPLNRYKERDVFNCQPLELRVGDRLRFTRNHREHHQTNGQPYTIEALNENGSIEIRTKGQHYTLTPDQLLHSDYAYCRTVYSAQGWTSAEAIWAPGQNPGQEQTYVALTRAKETLQIITLDRTGLGLSAQQTQTQENALDLIYPAHPSSVLESETHQLTLFPGESNEPERKTARPRIQPKQSDRNPSGPHHSTQQTAGQTEQAEPTLPAASIVPASAAAPSRRGLREFAESFGNLGAEPEAMGLGPDPAQESDRAGARTAPDPTADNGELLGYPDPIEPNPSDLANPTASPHPTDRPIEPAAAAPGDLDEPELEPSAERNTETRESLEPDSSPTERDRTEHQSNPDHFPSDDREREPVEFIHHPDEPEREIHATARADGQTDEHPRDSAQESAQTASLEAIALQWSDPKLLAIERQVQDYFNQEPPEPDWEQGQQLQVAVKRLAIEQQQRSRVMNDYKAQVKRLGVPRSWAHPFGASPQEVNAAKANLEESQLSWWQGKQQLEQAQASFEQWQKPARAYQEWRQSERGEPLHQLREILNLEPVQERLTQVHQALYQEQKRLEQVQKIQQGLKVMAQWQAAAISLERPEAYIERIQELTVAYRRGESLSEQAIRALTQDLDAYQERQQQRSPRIGGFGL
jgi:conjugative relaxase-like TrwC/TraI family protein